MKLDLDSLKEHLDKFADEFKLAIIKEIGNLAVECSSVDDFKSRLDELSHKTIGKTSLEVLMGLTPTRLPEFSNPEISSELRSSENSALQNELVAVEKKIDKLNDRDKAQQAESKS